jgi:predicted permease
MPQAAAQSGMLKAGTILLLVGAILATAGAALLVLIGTPFLVFLGAARAEASFAAIGAIYLFLGLVVGVGAIFAWLAWRRALAGNLQGAWTFGLVAALVPPVQLLPLIGAILVLVSPEAEAQKAKTQ